MDWDFLVSLIVRGLLLGSVYGLVALGFVLVYKATSALNFAQGEWVMLAGFLAVAFYTIYGFPLWAAIVITLAIMIALGFAVERAILRPMIGRPVLGMIMATLGMGIFLRGYVPVQWGVQTRSLDLGVPDEPYDIAGVSIPPIQVVGAIVALAMFILFGYLFQRTRMGLALRAVADDQQAAMAMGVRVTTVFAIAWAMSGIAAVAGGLVWGDMLGVDQYLSLLGLKVFPVIILGGIESILGALVGGLIVGMTENLAAGYFDPYVGGGLKDFVPFVLMLFVLMVRPSGLFGREHIERV